jgi:oxepin-CoA hydrolase / 3-oxo-5,6-dehydrosuberyl-CoA semialdehyde dehydrogenase
MAGVSSTSPSRSKLTFHERSDMLRQVAAYLTKNNEPLYALAGETGATRRDNLIDIDGGIGTLGALASRATRTAR